MIETKVAGFRPFALERYFAEHEFSVTFNLAASDCETLSMQALLELASPQARSLWENLSLGYASRGFDRASRGDRCRLREWAPGRSSYGRSG